MIIYCNWSGINGVLKRETPHMLCYAMLCYAMLSYAMLCYAMLCCAMLCYAMLCYAMLCYAMLCYAVFKILTLRASSFERILKNTQQLQNHFSCLTLVHTLRATNSYSVISDGESLHGASKTYEYWASFFLDFFSAGGFADVSAKLIITSKGSQPLKRVIAL